MIPGVSQFDGEGPGLAPSAAVAADPAASPVSVAQSSSMYSPGPAVSSSAQGTAPVKTKAGPKAIDKSKWNTGIKVPQATVDAVKAAGKGNMGVNAATNAQGTGAKYNGSSLMPNQPASPQYQEAVKRVYPNAYAQAANKAASGRPNSPYGFGGVSQTPGAQAPAKPKTKSIATNPILGPIVRAAGSVAQDYGFRAK